MMDSHLSPKISFAGSTDGYLSNSRLFSPFELETMINGSYSSLRTSKGVGSPCGGKNYFKYHPDALFNPYTGEIKMPDHIKESSESMTPKQVNEQPVYMKLDGTDQKLEKISNEALFHNHLSTYEEEIYKKNRLYEINKIYKGIREIIEKLSLNKIFDELNSKKSRVRNKLKKKIINKEEIKESVGKDGFNFNEKEIAFLFNLWLFLILTNPDIDRRFEFLREFLFFGKGK